MVVLVNAPIKQQNRIFDLIGLQLVLQTAVEELHLHLKRILVVGAFGSLILLSLFVKGLEVLNGLKDLFLVYTVGKGLCEVLAESSLPGTDVAGNDTC